jgi:Ca-activated chloride channel family protein
MSFLAPAAFFFALLLPVIIAMYLLKLRRSEQIVSSVYLWRRMVRDIEANAPWQRLRRNLLLIVQLFFLALLILALARPFTWAEGVGGQAVILILDTSASMASTDVAPDRLGAAKAQAQRLVDGLPDDVRVTVIAAGDGAQVLSASSRDRRQVRLAIEGVQVGAQIVAGQARQHTPPPYSGEGMRVGARDSDLTVALELASAIAARQPDTEIIIFSDGQVTLPERLALKGHVRYMPMGMDGDNQAISVLSLTAAPGGGLAAFAQVTNYGDASAHRRLSLYADGQLFNAYDLEIAPHGQRSVAVDDLPSETRIVEARLTGQDTLSLDDRAWDVYRHADPAAVTLVTEGNLFLETALSLLSHLEVTTIRPQDFEAGEGGSANHPTTQPPNLTLFDAYVPITATLPAGNLFFIAPPRSTDYFTVTGVVEQPVPRAVAASGDQGEATDPLLTHVNLAEVGVLEAVRIPLPAWARPVIAGDLPASTSPVQPGGDSSTPLLFGGGTGGRRIAVLAFDLRRSDLPLQVAFPLLMANLVDWLAPAGGSDLPTQVEPGAAMSFSLPPEVESVWVTRPDGSRTRLLVERGSAVFADTAQLGIYQATWSRPLDEVDRTDQGQISFAVNLFSPQESDVKPADDLSLFSTRGYGEADAGEPTQARREWWRPLAFVALALLIVEWLMYTRSTLALLWARIK